MLSELRQEEEWIVSYHDALNDWAAEVDRSTFSTWSLPEFWLQIEHENHRVREPTRLFIRRWLELVTQGSAQMQDSPAARELVRLREIRLKGAQSRFENRSVRDRWGGRSGAHRLSFRWTEASSHIRDLIDAR